MKLVVLITAQVEAGLDIAQAWQDANASGVTIIRSHGLHTLQQGLTSGQVELPRVVVSMGAAMAAILDNVEERGVLFFSAVEDDLVDALITAANSVLGDLNEPNSGILFVLPIERTVGVRRHDDT
jgi:hypothetical protein